MLRFNSTSVQFLDLFDFQTQQPRQFDGLLLEPCNRQRLAIIGCDRFRRDVDEWLECLVPKLLTAEVQILAETVDELILSQSLKLDLFLRDLQLRASL